jgi:Uma2 family endonuclease
MMWQRFDMSTEMQVNSAAPRHIPSDDELMALPNDGYKRELLHGEIVMSPAGFGHGRKIMRFAAALMAYVYQRRLGEIADGQTGFRMRNGDVLSPDLSFIAQERIAGLPEEPEGFFEGAPDLAVEFLSPGDSRKNLLDKLAQYFANGTRLAWVMDSKRRTVAIHRGAEPARVLGEGDDLSGEEVVPGFTIPVSEIFLGLDRSRG